VSSEYTFGDDRRAAQRLALLAEVFGPTSEAFLRARGVRTPALAVDLGAGAGHTTELLVGTLEPERTIAIESSPAFAQRARDRLGATAEVLEGDVRTLPHRVTDADVIFARLLLTHLSDPLGAVAHWRSRLAPGGVLLLEEVDGIQTEDPVFCDYLDRQREMLGGHGHTLDIGPRLHRELGDRPRTTSVQAVCPVAAREAARMFALNFESWRGDGGDEIAAGLQQRATGRMSAGAITWRMRQIAIGG
jgi:SAM-dependent methyltransferase